MMQNQQIKSRTTLLALASAALFITLPHVTHAKLINITNSSLLNNTVIDTALPDLNKNQRYVALGSSFAAEPGVAKRALLSPIECTRSSANFAQLLSKKRGFALVDESCSGATTANVLNKSQITQAPQINSVNDKTALVTLTIGGNDISYIGNLFAWSCEQNPKGMPIAWRAMYCKPKSDQEVDQALAALPQQFAQIASEVRRRAPQATLVFVDYTTVLPKTGSCPKRLPITDAQLQRSRNVAQRLVDITAKAAQDAGATLIQASKLTEGHDVCAKDPWVYDYKFAATPVTFGAMAYHPNEKAMKAIADELDRVLPQIIAVR